MYIAYKITRVSQLKIEHYREEWAFSGEKKYKKFGFAADVNSPLNDRYGMGVWDGKFYKLYDSGTNGGSVRSKYDSKEPNNPFDFSSIYSRFFGTFEEGSISQLLKDNPIKQWCVEIIEPDSKICVSCNFSENTTAKWHINFDKNCMVEKFEQASNNLATGQLLANLELVVSESKEIKPGIWLPMEAQESVTINGKIFKNHLEVEKLIINDPEIEKVFLFEFPKGSMYYDYILGKSVHAD